MYFQICSLNLFIYFFTLELFTENDVSANQYYGFQTSSKKNAMVQKAMLCRTPATVKTPEKLPVAKIIIEKLKGNTLSAKDTGKKYKTSTYHWLLFSQYSYTNITATSILRNSRDKKKYFDGRNE